MQIFLQNNATTISGERKPTPERSLLLPVRKDFLISSRDVEEKYFALVLSIFSFPRTVTFVHSISVSVFREMWVLKLVLFGLVRLGGGVGVVVRTIAFYQCGPGSIISALGVKCWLFVGSLLFLEWFFAGFSGFPLSPKTNIWFDLWKTILNIDLSYVDLISSRIVNCHWKTPCGELSTLKYCHCLLSILPVKQWS